MPPCVGWRSGPFKNGLGAGLLLVAVPGAGHCVHPDMLEPVSKTMRFRLNRGR